MPEEDERMGNGVTVETFGENESQQNSFDSAELTEESEEREREKKIVSIKKF